jgi:phosphate transport system substrate-binding protein
MWLTLPRHKGEAPHGEYRDADRRQSGAQEVSSGHIDELPMWTDGTTLPSTPNGSTADGNAGMIAKIHDTPYSIGYVGVSFHGDVAKAGIGTAALKSYDGEFLLPTPQSIEAAAAALWPRTPLDERLTLVNAPGANAYPLINYEYAIVSKKQPSPEIAAALRSFLLWAIAPDETNAQYLADSDFIPLPAHVWVLSHDQIEEIR